MISFLNRSKTWSVDTYYIWALLNVFCCFDSNQTNWSPGNYKSAQDKKYNLPFTLWCTIYQNMFGSRLQEKVKVATFRELPQNIWLSVKWLSNLSKISKSTNAKRLHWSSVDEMGLLCQCQLLEWPKKLSAHTMCSTSCITFK